MPNQLTTDEFLSLPLPIIDVRSPGEFEQAHIPGAVNIPLFDNDERAQVGTKYKQAGKEAAVLLGLELIGPKLADFVRKARKLNPTGRQLLVHCWRGGMRSGSMAWLLNTAGLETSTLMGGYKAYRNAVLDGVAQPYSLIILGGKTGSGKTDVLQELARLGEQVIDLEGLANHKGSSYGAIGQMPQPRTEQFENSLYSVLRHLNPARPVWVEDESRNIGTCFIPGAFYTQMRAAPVLYLDLPKAMRVARLVRDYTGIDHALLVEATKRIERRLGGKGTSDALTALASHDYATVADLTLDYYDKAYLHGLSQRSPVLVEQVPVSEDNPAQTAKLLVEQAYANLTLP